MIAAMLLLAQASAPTCADRDDILRHLAADKWREAVVARALDNTGRLVETVANPDTGTWTQLVTTPGGKTCIAASGDGWSAVEYHHGDPA